MNKFDNKIEDVLKDLNNVLGIKRVSLKQITKNNYVLNDKYIIKINCKFYEMFFRSIYSSRILKYRLLKNKQDNFKTNLKQN